MTKKKDDGTNTLYKAIERYVRLNGGKIIVIGGIELQRGHAQYNFKLAVSFTGKPPEKPKEKP